MFDAFLLLSFGGPEGPDDVMPFLRNVTRGRGIPDERLAEVAEHYYHFGGVSPINAQNKALLAAIEADFAEHGINLPLYWGNRNWHPMLEDTIRQMRDDGVRRVVAFATAAYSSYSACRQYLDDIDRARAAVPDAPEIVKIPPFYHHPGFITSHLDGARAALESIEPSRRQETHLVGVAHSIPVAMAAASGSRDTRDAQPSEYERQLRYVTAKLAAELGTPWTLAWQSRSGAPHVPWLEPDINDHLRELAKAGVRDVVLSPVGFVSDHLEVAWDLDVEAVATAGELGINLVRAATSGTHPAFVAMIRDLCTHEFVREPAGCCGANCCAAR